MPSLRQISTSRSAQEQNAPTAQTVITCHRPPSRKGASLRPYARSGGAMLICHRFQVGPIAAPYRIIAMPTIENKAVVTPKKPT
jgi:hypothetical protein